MEEKYYLRLKNISKLYPGIKALQDVSFHVKQGEVHALLGENGAGKSTLIKVLSGAIQPNGGEIIIGENSYSHMTPALSASLGIGVIYQEFNLMPAMDVTENIFLGNEARKLKIGIINKKAMVEKTRELFNTMGIAIDPLMKVRELSVAYQQLVEIAKAVSKKLKVLVMDEPTAPLTDTETQTLFRVRACLMSPFFVFLANFPLCRVSAS